MKNQQGFKPALKSSRPLRAVLDINSDSVRSFLSICYALHYPGKKSASLYKRNLKWQTVKTAMGEMHLPVRKLMIDQWKLSIM